MLFILSRHGAPPYFYATTLRNRTFLFCIFRTLSLCGYSSKFSLKKLSHYSDTTTKEWQDANPGLDPKKIPVGVRLNRPEHLQEAPKANLISEIGSFMFSGASMLATGSDVDPFTREVYNEGEAQDMRMNAAMFLGGIITPSGAAGVVPKIKLNAKGAEKIWMGLDSKLGSIFHYGAPGKYGPHFAIGKTHFYKNGFWKPGMEKMKPYGEVFKGLFSGVK